VRAELGARDQARRGPADNAFLYALDLMELDGTDLRRQGADRGAELVSELTYGSRTELDDSF
jgi:hypothetical protein